MCAHHSNFVLYLVRVFLSGQVGNLIDKVSVANSLVFFLYFATRLCHFCTKTLYIKCVCVYIYNEFKISLPD